jgi:hypothetical protein
MKEPRTSISPRRPAIAFPGLDESDFKNTTEGTTWRSRGRLGGLVAQQLSDMSGRQFLSLSIYRRSQLYVYARELSMGTLKSGVRLPKFIVRLDPRALSYGFYIEKSDERMGSDWYWPRFLDLLSDTAWQEKIVNTMIERKLQWVLRFEPKKDASCNYGKREETTPAFAQGSESPTFPAFLTHLQNLPPPQWCNLYIEKTTEKAEALAMKEEVSRPIVQTLNALVPMYLRLLKPISAA